MLLAHTREGDRYVFDQPLRLLAVDDDPIMREFAVAQLSQPGCEIVTAEDGEAAWDILQGDARGFDLVLTDLEMPRLNGFGLLGQIRAGARFAHLPVSLSRPATTSSPSTGPTSSAPPPSCRSR